MPFTEKQRKMFNAKAKQSPEMARLADEANQLKKKGAEKRPVKPTTKKKTAKKATAKKKR